MNIQELNLDQLIDISHEGYLKEKNIKEQQNLEFKQEVKKDFINKILQYGSNFRFPFTYYIIPSATDMQRSETEIQTIVTKAIEETLVSETSKYKPSIHSYNEYYDINTDRSLRKIIVGYTTS